jgi:glycosyltransferase involved in cell wall biosynthesis
VKELKLSSVVRFHGNVSHREAVRLMGRSHVLLLFEVPVRDGEPTLVLPSKLFEYMAARRPIMAMVTEGDSAEIVREYKLGSIVDPLNIENMAEKIDEYFDLFSQNQLKVLPPASAVFSREAQAKKFAEMIQRMAL